MSKSRALHNREERKKNSSEGKVYSYGRGARKTTDYGEYALATQQVAYAPSGKSGSMKVQSMKNKQQAYENAFSSAKAKRKR